MTTHDLDSKVLYDLGVARDSLTPELFEMLKSAANYAKRLGMPVNRIVEGHARQNGPTEGALWSAIPPYEIMYVKPQKTIRYVRSLD